MAILPVPKVVATFRAKADEYNRLVDAICDISGGHDHTGAANHGKKIDHADLTTIGVNTHAELDAWKTAHDAATSAVHGLGAGEYVLGSTNSAGLVVAGGRVSVALADTVDNAWSATEEDGLYQLDQVTGLASVVTAWCSLERNVLWEGSGFWLPPYMSTTIEISGGTVTFRLRLQGVNNDPIYVYWMALGNLA